MFTGIIQGMGNIDKLSNFNDKKIDFKTDLDLSDCVPGSSICCDGVCLTTTSIVKNNNIYFFKVNIGEETVKRSTAKFWNKNTIINIEKSLKVGDEISGHFVYGHIDCTAKLTKIIQLTSSWNYYFSLNNGFDKVYKKFIVEKGSIAINGISLTIANVKEDVFYVSIIPYTYNNTNLSKLNVGNSVNIEFDSLAKYIHSKNG